MIGLFSNIAGRLGMGTAPAVPIDPREAAIDAAIARRRAARPARTEDHDRAWAKRHAEMRAADPILRLRDVFLEKRA